MKILRKLILPLLLTAALVFTSCGPANNGTSQSGQQTESDTTAPSSTKESTSAADPSESSTKESSQGTDPKESSTKETAEEEETEDPSAIEEDEHNGIRRRLEDGIYYTYSVEEDDLYRDASYPGLVDAEIRDGYLHINGRICTYEGMDTETVLSGNMYKLKMTKDCKVTWRDENNNDKELTAAEFNSLADEMDKYAITVSVHITNEKAHQIYIFTNEKAAAENQYTLPFIIGIWFGDDGVWLMLREDMTCLYVNLLGASEEEKTGIEGTWEYGKGDTLRAWVTMQNKAYAFFAKVVEENWNPVYTLNCDNGQPWTPRKFEKTQWNEKDLYDKIATEKAAREGYVISMYNSGTYYSSQTSNPDDLNSANNAYFTTARLVPGDENHSTYLYVEGNIGQYDENWNESIYMCKKIMYVLNYNAKIWASGGAGPDQEVDVSYFNSCFNDHFTGLGLSFKVGLLRRVTDVYICS